MTAILGSFAGYLHALLRIVAGYGYFLHGAQKIFGVLGAEQPMPIMSLMGAAGSIELVGGALIALGLFTPWVAFIASGEMAFAYFMGHVARSGGALFPVTNQGEAAVLYCFIFLYLAAKGTGPFGLDGLRTSWRMSPTLLGNFDRLDSLSRSWGAADTQVSMAPDHDAPLFNTTLSAADRQAGQRMIKRR